MTRIIFSKTALQRGYGIDHNKKVLLLSKQEQQAIKDGADCFFFADRPAHPSGRNDLASYLRTVKYYPSQNLYGPRVPTIKQIEGFFQKFDIREVKKENLRTYNRKYKFRP